MSSFSTPVFSHPGYITGLSYGMWPGLCNIAAAVPAVDLIYFHPFILTKPITFTQGQARVVTGGAGSSVKSGIWADSSVSHRPLGAPLFKDDTGVATTANNTTVVLAFAGTLGPGFYWAGMKFTGTLPVVYNTGGAEMRINWMVGTTLVTGNGFTFADAYANAMPTIAEAASFTVANNIPVMFLQT